jgi:hypothetical protein
MITKNDLSIISIRALAIYSLLQGLSKTLLQFSGPHPKFLSSWAMLVLAFVLWLSAPRLQNLMVGGQPSDPDSDPKDVSIQEIQIVAVTVLGLILVVFGIAEFFGSIMFAHVFEYSSVVAPVSMQGELIAAIQSERITSLAKVGFGIILVGGANYITLLTKSLQSIKWVK